ncbi:UDP-glycosyltransferase UGT5 [Zeugodacus cucurbitae]|uniref:UDP-glucuronosyltransferase 1-6 n=1 Tax=Zeugodacus cucurbitae TaxID=28588 RepID=A0A0A1X147_ZEUCU|nr:UDP-glycosyltransferase UGT5 [Zeugodacus cucurbitae]
MKCCCKSEYRGLIAIAIVAIIGISTGVQPVSSANILGVFLSSSPSHLIVHMSIMQTLAENGHNITVVSTLKPKINHPKIHNIVIEPTEARQKEMDEELSVLGVKKQNPLVMMMKFFRADNAMITLQLDAVKSEKFQSIYNNKYDLVIMGYFINNFQFIVPAKLKCPVIISWTGPPMEMINDFVGVPHEVSYVPSVFTPHINGEVMSFGLRLFNFVSNGLLRLATNIMDITFEGLYKELAADDPTLRTFSQMKQNVSLIFCNSHFSEGPIRPLVPNLVEIGGIQIKEKPTPLPKNIADFLNASKGNGAILFSLGSNMKSTSIQPKTVNIIYKVLSSLPQNVIWKWENLDNTPGNASNILYQKWLPQDDILAHPNLKLFITHAGKGGMVEATYHSVPMVAMPVFAEQPTNAAKIVSSGYGLQVDIINLKENEFRDAILEVLHNPVYRNNVRRFSELYRNRPMTARENVNFWVEYVLRHQGAAHMQSPLIHLNFVQSNSLDVILAILLILYLLWKLMKFTIKLLCKLIYLAIGTLKAKSLNKSKRE